MHDVVTIGSTTRDAFYKVKFPTISWPKTPSGRAYVLPRGTKLEVDDIYYTIGGNAANASVTFARQGFRVAAEGKIGTDLAGDGVLERLREEGVTTNLIARTSEKGTAYSVLLLQDGERTILAYHGASDTFTMRDLRLSVFRAKWWYLSLAGESYKMFMPLMQFAKKNGIAVAFNPSGYHLRRDKKGILRLLKDVAFLCVNDEEAAMLAGIPWRHESRVFKKLDALLSPGLMRRCQVSGVRCHDLGKDDIRYAIRLATANATSVVEHIGATEGTLTKREFNAPRWKKLNIAIREA